MTYIVDLRVIGPYFSVQSCFTTLRDSSIIRVYLDSFGIRNNTTYLEVTERAYMLDSPAFSTKKYPWNSLSKTVLRGVFAHQPGIESK